MSINKDNTTTLLLAISRELHKAFKDYCESEGMTMAKRIRLLMKQDMEKKTHG